MKIIIYYILKISDVLHGRIVVIITRSSSSVSPDWSLVGGWVGRVLASLILSETELYIKKTCPCSIQRFLKLKKNENFVIFAQKIDCGYILEPPRRGGRRGGSNE